MRRATTMLGWLAVTAIGAATLAGLLAPFSAILDLPNHFRPHLLIGAIVASILAALLKAHRLVVTAMAFALLNFALAIPPFFFLAAPAANSEGKSIKVVMANVWGGNTRFGPLATFLRNENADIVLLAEADPPIARALADLSDLYPYRSDCIGRHYCRLALLSRFPVAEAHAIDRSNETPPNVVASIDVDGNRITVIGTHLARPYSQRWQTREIDFLVNELAAINGPVILLGDFNATPWSWTMLSLQLRAGLVRHKTLGASWPANIALPPQLLLEQILTRGGIGRGTAYLGPQINSDHLPLVVTMTLPIAR